MNTVEKILLFVWAVFLVLIGTFGGQAGINAAAFAGTATAVGLWFWLLANVR